MNFFPPMLRVIFARPQYFSHGHIVRTTNKSLTNSPIVTTSMGACCPWRVSCARVAGQLCALGARAPSTLRQGHFACARLLLEVEPARRGAVPVPGARRSSEEEWHTSDGIWAPYQRPAAGSSGPELVATGSREGRVPAARAPQRGRAMPKVREERSELPTF